MWQHLSVALWVGRSLRTSGRYASAGDAQRVDADPPILVAGGRIRACRWIPQRNVTAGLLTDAADRPESDLMPVWPEAVWLVTALQGEAGLDGRKLACRDLESASAYGECGFDSNPRHHGWPGGGPGLLTGIQLEATGCQRLPT